MVLLKLSFEHWRCGEVCPNLVGLPACYILSIAVLLAILSHLKIFNDKEIFFFLGAGLAWTVALIASVLQTTGRIECPKTLGNFPLCYLSLIVFSVVFLLRFLSSSKN